MHLVVYIFVVLWLFIVGISCVFTLSLLLNKDQQTGENGAAFFNGIPIVMFIFGVALFIGGFKWETVRSKKFLARLL